MTGHQKLAPISSIGVVTSGGTPDRSVPGYWGGNIPWVKTSLVQNSVIRACDIDETITEEGLRHSSAKLVSKGAILLAMVGQGKTRGQVALLDADAAVNQNCAALILNGKADRYYVFQQLLFRYAQIRLLSNSSGQQNLNATLIRSIAIPIPPLLEQQRIGQLLCMWDTAIQKTEELCAAKKLRKEAILSELLAGKKRVNGYCKPWSCYRLGTLFSERNEPNRPDLPLLAITNQDGVVLREELNRRDSSNEDKSKYLRICPGDIGYNTMRMWQGVSGLSAHEGIVSPAYTVCTPSGAINGKFASYLFKLPATIHLFYKHSQGLTSDTWNLKFRHFSQIQVRIPHLDEQLAIASILTHMDEELSLENRRLEALKQQKRGLMQELLTGKLGEDEKGVAV